MSSSRLLLFKCPPTLDMKASKVSISPLVSSAACTHNIAHSLVLSHQCRTLTIISQPLLYHNYFWLHLHHLCLLINILCMYVSIHMHMYVCTHVYVRMYVIHIHNAHAHMYMYMYVRVHTCTCTHVLYVYMYTHVCMHTYICIHTRTYVFTHMYICIHALYIRTHTKYAIMYEDNWLIMLAHHVNTYVQWVLYCTQRFHRGGGEPGIAEACRY